MRTVLPWLALLAGSAGAADVEVAPGAHHAGLLDRPDRGHGRPVPPLRQASGYRPEAEADGSGGYGYRADREPATSPRGDAFEGRSPRWSWRDPGFAQGDDHPVVNVTWNDAQALAAWLSRPRAGATACRHGNVWEWVADWHGDDYYAHAPLDDPQGPADGGVRVRRGGSWHTWAFYARSSYRNWNSPDTRYTLVGIRLARDD